MSSKQPLWGGAALFLVPVLLTFSTVGQNVHAEEARPSIMEEIVVTSRRREENQQDVPLSVTAFGAEAIEQLKPTTLRDFDGLAPNVYIGMNTAGPSASALFIRGVGYADIEKTQTPQVGVIVDGVQIGSSTGQLIDVFDVESIEVNRGPQGLFFGKNTIAGNIVVNRTRPNTEEFGYKVSAEIGNFDSQILKGRVNIPLGEMFALKLGAIDREREGFYDNLTIGGTQGDVDFSSQTAALRFQPNESFDAILTYDRIDDTSQIPPQDPRFNGDQPFENLADKREPTDYQVDQISLRVDWDLNDSFTLNSITAIHDATDTVNQDFDGGAVDGPAIPFAQLHTLRDQDFEVFTQELRLNWAVNDSLDIMVGAYFYDSELDFVQLSNQILQLPPIAIANGAFAGQTCGFIAGATGIGLRPHPTLGDVICQFPNSLSTQDAGEDVESTSFFASVNFRPTENLEINIGARLIDEEKDATNSYLGYSNNTFFPGGPDTEFTFPSVLPVTNPGFSYEVSDDWDDVIGAASVKYQFSDNAMSYVSYSEGFRSGGFSIRNARNTPGDAPYDPENAEQFEVGIKTEWLDGRLRANLSYFQLDREDAQFSSIITLPPGSIRGTTTLINNGGESEITGWELETQFIINENWSLIANGGIIDVDNEEFTLPCEAVDGCVTGVVGVLDPPGTLRTLGGGGTRESRQPEWNANVTLAFNAEMGPGFLSANVGWKKVGSFLLVNTGGGADQRLFEGGYKGVDARVAYEWNLESGDTLVISAFGKNLTDEEWREQALFLGGFNTGFQGWGAPRTYAIELTYEH